MLRRSALILTLVAWLLATGSQWDLVQTFAWGRMIATHSRTMSLQLAVEKTFDGEMCRICLAVQEAKDQQDAGNAKSPASKLPGKIILTSAPNALVFLSPASFHAGVIFDESAPLSADRFAPPSPPPRVLA